MTDQRDSVTAAELDKLQADLRKMADGVARLASRWGGEGGSAIAKAADALAALRKQLDEARDGAIASALETMEAVIELRAANAQMAAALRRSVVALDDWLNLYASELCNDDRVAEAKKRVHEVGTLAYIADVQADNRAALAPAAQGEIDALGSGKVDASGKPWPASASPGVVETRTNGEPSTSTSYDAFGPWGPWPPAPAPSAGHHDNCDLRFDDTDFPVCSCGLEAAPAPSAGGTRDNDLIRRGDVIAMLARLGDQHADLALYGAPENARNREAMEAACTRARCAVALMHAAPAPSAGETVPPERKLLDRIVRFYHAGIDDRTFTGCVGDVLKEYATLAPAPTTGEPT